jgi:TRAP-type C4-dicarboxylate transport system substrate-binding protein
MRGTKVVSVFAGVLFTAMASAASAETWRFGIEETEGSVQYKYAQKFKEMIEDKSGGDVTVRVLPYGEWGSVYTALYDAVQSGSLQIAFGSGALGSTVPESQLMSLNYVMPPDQKKTAEVLNADKFLHSDAWEKAFTARGLYPLAMLPEGYQVWTANKAIKSPDDIKGVNIRTMDNSLLLNTYRGYGAAPSNIAYGELYSAMQQGQVEGNIQPVWAHENMSFYEVQDYMIFAKQAQFIAALFGNHEWYKNLSDAKKEMIRSTTEELVSYGHETQTKLNDRRMETIKNNSDIYIIKLNEQQRAEFRELAKPVREMYVEDVGERGKRALNILLEEFGEEPVQ